MKSDVDELGIDKLVHVRVDLSKLSDIVKNDVVKKTEYNELAEKVNNINPTTNGSNLVKKLTITQKLMKLKKKKILIIIIVIRVLLHKNLIS